MADGHITGTHGIRVNAHGRTVLAIGSGSPADGHGPVTFRMGVGTHGDTAHVQAAFADFYFITNLVSAFSIRRRFMILLRQHIECHNLTGITAVCTGFFLRRILSVC